MLSPKPLLIAVLLLFALLFISPIGIAQEDSGLPPGVSPDVGGEDTGLPGGIDGGEADSLPPGVLPEEDNFLPPGVLPEEDNFLPPGVFVKQQPVVTSLTFFPPFSPNPGAPLSVTVSATDDVSVSKLVLIYTLDDTNEPPFERSARFCPGDSTTPSGACKYTFDKCSAKTCEHTFTEIWATTRRNTKFTFTAAAIDSDGLESEPKKVSSSTTSGADDGPAVTPAFVPPANSPPVVAQFELPSTADKNSDITATVVATDADGSVARIEILKEDGATVITNQSCGNIASCTKSFTLRVADAFSTTYTFIARVFDNLGAQATKTKSGTTNAAPTPTPSPAPTLVPALAPAPAPTVISLAKALEKVRVKLPAHELFVRTLVPDSECLAPGEESFLYTSLKNTGEKKVRNIKLTAIVYGLDIRTVSGPFDLGSDDSASRLLYFSVPEDAKPGEYYIRLTASSDKDTIVKHRLFEVRNSC